MRVFTTRFVRSAALVVVLGLAGASPVRADEALRRVQQSLRDQGFYYGPVDGSPGDETTQALRRYQIRNGLTVNGQLNDETRHSIERAGASGGAGSNSRSGGNSSEVDASTPPPLGTPAPARRVPSAPVYSTPAPTPAYRPAPARPQPGTDEGDDAPPVVRSRGNIRPDLRVRPDAPSEDGGFIPRSGIASSANLSALLASTPYEFAPPPVQADVLRRAQVYLTRNGFYDGRADGVPGAGTSEALANFQEVNRLRRTGRLDVSTLGTMRLLPGRQTVGPRRDDDRRRGPDIIFQGRVVD